MLVNNIRLNIENAKYKQKKSYATLYANIIGAKKLS